MSDQRIAMITGVSSGIGRATATELAQAGFRVFGTARSERSEMPEGVERLLLDVRDEASVNAAVSELLQRAGRIDVVVNNAGSSILGAIEEVDTDQAQALFDVNFFGAVRVTRAVLPSMRARGAGRIIFIGSVAGFLPFPFMGFYAASKHAIEGYAETLDHETRNFGVRAVLVEPGFMKTRIDENAVEGARRLEEYDTARARVGAHISKAIETGEDPSIVAKTVVRAATASAPRLRYPVGKGTATLARLRSFMPASIFDRTLRKEMHLEG